MLVWTFNVVIYALAFLAPVLMAWLYIERRAHERTQILHADMQLRWIDRYRSMTDIIVGMVEVNQKMAGHTKRTYELVQRLQADNRDVMAFLRKVIRST